MEHFTLKAVTTATDQGLFTAVISAASIDREKDIVDPAGMVRALSKWVPTGKKIPLAWNHSTAAEDIIGSVDPSSAKAVNGEVVVSGWIDQSTPRGGEAWRLVKSGVLGFSFGYLVPDGGSSKRKGGGRHITELDVFEITATPTPMNADTRVVGWKAMAMDDPQMLLSMMLMMGREYIDNAPDSEDASEMQSILADLNELVSDVDDAADQAEDATGKELRRRADKVALEHAVGGQMPRGKAQREKLPAGAEWLFPEGELSAARAGEVKAVWTTSYVNELPDSAFLHVDSGGEKDSDGKSMPRSLRHFPVKDMNGAVDMAHLRNAMSRIPQSNLSQSVKDSSAATAQRMMDESKTVDETDQERKQSRRARSVDPLRAKADAVALEFASDGESLKKPPRQKVAPKPAPELELDELRRRTRDEMLIALSGVEP